MRFSIVCSALVLALGVAVQGASAQVVNTGIVVNGGFEADAVPDFPGYTDTITGWIASGTNAIINDADGPFYEASANGPIPEGNQVGGMQGDGSLSQALSGLDNGEDYLLRLFVNARACCPPEEPGTMGLRVRLGTEVLREIAPVPVTSTFQLIQQPFVYDAAWGNTLELEFFDAQGDATVLVDGVGLFVESSTFPPVPGGVPVAGPIGLAALLAGIAVGGAVAVRRQRRHRE